MSTVWFFGDSFCNPCEVPTPDYWWGSIFAKKHNYDIKLKSAGGAAIEYLNISLNENLGNIKKGDVVFISYTNKDRFYFYGKNALHTGNTFLDVQTMSEGGEEINDAIRKFLLHIYESEEHGKLWYTQIIYTQSCIVPMLESMGIKVHEFYSFEPDSFDDMFLKLKELPIANNFITDECNKLSIDAGELLHTSGHFGNQETKLNLNKQWSDLFE